MIRSFALLLVASLAGCGTPTPPPATDLPQVQPITEVAPMPRAAER